MRVAWLLVLASACGPGLAGKDTKVAAGNELAAAVNDVAKMTALLRNGGLWFDDSPYQVNDEPVPVCTYVTFIYKQG